MKTASQRWAICFGAVIRERARRAGENQVETARRVGASQSMISRIQQGLAIPDALLFRRLAGDAGADALYETVDAVSRRADLLLGADGGGVAVSAAAALSAVIVIDREEGKT